MQMMLTDLPNDTANKSVTRMSCSVTVMGLTIQSPRSCLRRVLDIATNQGDFGFRFLRWFWDKWRSRPQRWTDRWIMIEAWRSLQDTHHPAS